MSENLLRVGVVGLGTVGAKAVQLLKQDQPRLRSMCGSDIVVAAVSARDRTRDRGFELGNTQWFDDPVEMARNADVDLVVELVGGEDGAALDVVRAAIQAGRHVVTANKALLAKHGVSLAAQAEEKGVSLRFEAAIAGGIPIVKAMREALSGNRVSRVFGILNGTCNYILTEMETKGLSFDDCLKEAQRLGYAEADPTFDVEGNDTAHKLALLASMAFGTTISADDIYLEGITNISQTDIKTAADLGYRIKLLGVAHQTESGIEQRVHPTMVPRTSVIAQIDGVTNAVSVETDLLGEILLSGPGAGGAATASAIIADVCDIAKAPPKHEYPLGTPAKALSIYKRGPMRAHEGGYFIRLEVDDRVGVFAALTGKMAEQEISLESIVQRAPDDDTSSKTVILITHETTEQAIRNAVTAISDDGYLLKPAQIIRIEKAG